MALAVVCLVALGCGTVAVVRARALWWTCALYLLVVLAWLVVNKPLEGPILWTVNEHHGLTLGDVAVVPGLVVAAARAVLAIGRRRSAARQVEAGHHVEMVPDQREARVQR